MQTRMSDIAAQSEQFFGVSPFRLCCYADCELHVNYLQNYRN